MNDEVMTYLELDQVSNKIAYTLIHKGVIPSDILGVSLSRGFDLIASY